MIMLLDSMTLASCPFDLDKNRALKNQSKTATPISNANISNSWLSDSVEHDNLVLTVQKIVRP